MGNSMSCDPCTRGDSSYVQQGKNQKEEIGNSFNTHGGNNQINDNRRKFLESHMSNLNNRKRPTLK